MKKCCANCSRAEPRELQPHVFTCAAHYVAVNYDHWCDWFTEPVRPVTNRDATRSGNMTADQFKDWIRRHAGRSGRGVVG